MKKTITLLLAATSVAMAKTTDVTDLLVWDENNTTASLVGAGFTNSDITVVLTLNWQNFDTYSEAHDIFTISDDANHCLGLGMYFYYGEEKDFNLIYSNTGGVKYTNAYQGANYLNSANSAVVFTAGVISTTETYYVRDDKGNILKDEDGKYVTDKREVQKYTLTGYLYLWDGVNETPSLIEIIYDSNALDIDYTSLTLGPNSVVDKMAVYTGVTDNPLNLAEKMLGLSTPEPTTATLSLLALAGLAARRRRH